MNKCCCPARQAEDTPEVPLKHHCPRDDTKGIPVGVITLKSLLRGTALEQLDPQQTYIFCPSTNCPVVYFSEAGQAFTTADLKVPVFQKDRGEEVPICYCFDWTRQRIQEEIDQQGTSSASSSISTHIKARRCGCEFNNPQGSCCLGNVKLEVEQRLTRRPLPLHDSTNP